MIEPRVDRGDQPRQRLVGRKIRSLERIRDHEYVVAGDAPHVGAHGESGAAVLAAAPGGVVHPRRRGFALDRDVDAASLALEPGQERAPDADKLVQGRIRRSLEERGE